MPTKESNRFAADTLDLMEKIENSLQSTVPSLDEMVLGADMVDESGSSKYNESWPNTLPSFTDTPPQRKEQFPTRDEKEHSIEDFIQEQNSTLSK